MVIKSINKGKSSVFPQANDLYKIFEMGKTVFHEIHLKKEIMETVGIKHARQFDYYKNAAKYLGLFDSKLELSSIGLILFSQEKNIALPLLVFLILSVDIFLEYYEDRNFEKTIAHIQERYNFSEETAFRRSQTLKKWVEWCDIIISDFDINIEIEV